MDERKVELVHLISNVSDMVQSFEREKSKIIIQIEKLCKELKIDIEKIREEDELGYVDAVDYGRGFDANFFLRNIKEFERVKDDWRRK